MGASGWNYFTPYQEDVEQALQSLRQQVFESRTYGEGHSLKSSDFASSPSNIIWAFKGAQDADDDTFGEGEFSSIDELIEASAEEGAHSILDIQHTAAEPDFAAAWPAPSGVLIKIFGSAEPTHEQIAEKEAELTEVLELERWEAVYVIIYSERKPSEIYFEGISGD